MQAYPYGPHQDLPPDIDKDGDGWADETEQALGSDPADAASRPESQAVPGTCIDGLDNDGDGVSDFDDLHPTPSCGRVDLRSQLQEKRFPADGLDAFHSQIQIPDLAELLKRSESKECQGAAEGFPSGLSLVASGPTVIRRDDPITNRGGYRQIDVEITALQASGKFKLPDGPVIPFTIVKDKQERSDGRVVTLDPEREGDFPARASFDVKVEILLDLPEDLERREEIEPPEGEAPPRLPPPRIGCVRKTMVNPKVIILPPYDDKNPCYKTTGNLPGFIARHCVKAPNDVKTIRDRDDEPNGPPSRIQPKYVYSAKFLCGHIADVSSRKARPPFEPGDLFAAAEEPPVKPGNYATAINIHNPHPKAVIIAKKAVQAPREPDTGRPSRFHTMRLGPDEATEVDCADIARQLRLPDGTSFAKGFEVIESPITVDVVAVYTQEAAKERVLDKITCSMGKGPRGSRRPDPFVAIVQPPEGAVPGLSPGAVGAAYDPKEMCRKALRKKGLEVKENAKVKILDVDIGLGKGVGSSIEVEHIEPKVIENLPPIKISKTPGK